MIKIGRNILTFTQNQDLECTLHTQGQLAGFHCFTFSLNNRSVGDTFISKGSKSQINGPILRKVSVPQNAVAELSFCRSSLKLEISSLYKIRRDRS